jgi:hypothetical protein
MGGLVCRRSGGMAVRGLEDCTRKDRSGFSPLLYNYQTQQLLLRGTTWKQTILYCAIVIESSVC